MLFKKQKKMTEAKVLQITCTKEYSEYFFLVKKIFEMSYLSLVDIQGGGECTVEVEAVLSDDDADVVFKIQGRTNVS
jgi:hypothetical protein